MGKGSGACLGKSKAPAPKKAEQPAKAPAEAEAAAAPAPAEGEAAPAPAPAEGEAAPAPAQEEPAAETSAAAEEAPAPKTEEAAAAPAEAPAAEESTSTTTPAGETVTVEQPKEAEATPESVVESVVAAVTGEKKPKMLIVYYSMYGHVKAMAEQAMEGAKAVEGIDVEIYQVPETLPQEVLDVMHAPPKAEHPVLTYDLLDKLVEADGILFGIPTRFGMMSAQMKAFFDGTGGLWAKGALAGKLGGCFVSTATQNGGQESTLFTAVSQMAHHGMLFVPVGYTLGSSLYGMDEARGGGPFGAGTLASSDGSRQPSSIELDQVRHQGKYFAETIKRYVK